MKTQAYFCVERYTLLVSCMVHIVATTNHFYNEVKGVGVGMGVGDVLDSFIDMGYRFLSVTSD